VPARVVELHRSALEVTGDTGTRTLAITPSLPSLTVGDWLLLDAQDRVLRALERQSCFSRRAAGSKLAEQLLAANVDTVFVVCSLNDDFNLSRIERYLSLVHQAGVEPVVVLTKLDLCPDPGAQAGAVQAMDRQLCVVAVNALSADSAALLTPWCRAGQTVALLGSSGAGKSTLGNTLLGDEVQLTQAIRASDARGRHTTTRRSLLAMPTGAMILDTPGMRELQLADCQQGVAATFADVEEWARRCRFSDCQHGSEPGCAVLAALASGELEERRYRNYRKLLREQAFNGASLAERHAANRILGKHYRRTQKEARQLKGS
jgi:ribosome biogenesis GTPase